MIHRLPWKPRSLSGRAGKRLRHRKALRLLVVLGAIIGYLWATGCMERLFYLPTRAPTPPPTSPAGTEEVWFRASDGTRLFGWFIPARRDPADVRPAATILHVHGNAGNIESHVWFTEYLPEAGFNVFIFDFRGYGQSEGTPRRRGELIDDSNAALETLLARDDVDAGRIGLYGQSLGGAIGLNLMRQRPEISAAVIESSFASWREMAATAIGGHPPGPIARTLARLLIPDDHRPLDAVADIDRPVLILHGTADSIIPFDHGRRLAEAGGARVTLHALAGGDHNTLRSTHPEVQAVTIDFFRRNLGSTGNTVSEN